LASRNKPDRQNDHGPEQEILPEPAHGIEAHIPQVPDQPAHRIDDVPRIEPDGGEDHADQDRHQDQPPDDRERRPTEEALNIVLGHRLSPARRPRSGRTN
jgi:hypothetical protein